MKNSVVYIYDHLLRKEIDKLPFVVGRASVVTDLIHSYKLLSSDVQVCASVPATYEELRLFHSSAYLDFIKQNNNDNCDEDGTEFGLHYDCPLIPFLYNVIRLIAGSTITAAKLLCEGKCDVAINWFGGWHHAQRDEAEGFCYINDVVIGIQLLTQCFPKILYIDLDIHHGNGVQNAFELSKRVLTLSFHKYSPGFYPGTGGLNDIGCNQGKYFSLNVPLLEGCSGKSYLNFLMQYFPGTVFEKYQPSALVVQCGGDCIVGDRVGQANITPKAMGECVKKILKCKLPTLFLGGGGYNAANTARYWTYLTSIILEKSLEEDIPSCSEYFTKYEPSYELHIDEGNQRDHNTDEYTNTVIGTISKPEQLTCNLIMISQKIIISVILLIVVFVIIWNIYNYDPKGIEEIYVAPEILPSARKLFDLNFKYVIDTKCNYSNNTNLLAVILVTSYLGDVEIRSAMRRAFPMEKLQEFSIRRIFLLGLAPSDKYTSQAAIYNENKRFGDLLQGNFVEAYKNLTYKHMMGIYWAAMNCYQAKYVIKMDDDTVVNMHRLEYLLRTVELPKKLLAGYILKDLKPIRKKPNKWYITRKEYKNEYYPTFLSGWFYITNPFTCKELIKEYPKEPFFWVDDVYVTGILAQRARIKHFNIGEYFTVHSEFLECCMRDVDKFRYDCELVVGPNGGDNNLFYKFNSIVSKCFYEKCSKRNKTLNQTCVAEQKRPLGRGSSLIKAYPLS
ncbi:hypothetical protein FQR65_LT02410 [Abscondita terminalis]|nr:hypothetical protein FQR65_LT02410 [Abscondita terminalis]